MNGAVRVSLRPLAMKGRFDVAEGDCPHRDESGFSSADAGAGAGGRAPG